MAEGHERGAMGRRLSRRRFRVPSTGVHTMAQSLPPIGSPAANRRPRRLSITLPANVFKELERRSTLEGRSLSNLAAYVLEAGMAAGAPSGERR